MDLKKLTDTLQAMKRLEEAMCELYQTCAVTWANDCEVWNTLKVQEALHAENIEKIISLVNLKPGNFESNLNFNAFVINSIISEIQKIISQVKSNSLSMLKMLAIAKDYENSLLELKYGQIVKSNDIEFNNLIKTVVSQTMSHKNLLEEKIKSLLNTKL